MKASIMMAIHTIKISIHTRSCRTKVIISQEKSILLLIKGILLPAIKGTVPPALKGMVPPVIKVIKGILPPFKSILPPFKSILPPFKSILPPVKVKGILPPVTVIMTISVRPMVMIMITKIKATACQIA